MTDETKGDGMTIGQAISSMDALMRNASDQYETGKAWKLIKAHLAAQSAMRVDDAMVVRAMKAYDEASPLPSDLCMRAALQAAIGGRDA